MQAIIDKCKKVKTDKGYSYEYIAQQSGIPKSTVERFFSANGKSCRYDTVCPIVRFLVGFDEPVPESPKEIVKEMPLPLNEMIDLYREAIVKRESENEKLKEEHKAEIAELKAEHKQHIADLKAEYQNNIDAKHKTNIRLWITLIVILSLVGILIIADLQITGRGWIIK